MIYPDATPRLKRLTNFWMKAVMTDDKGMENLFSIEWSCEAQEEIDRRERLYMENKNRLIYPLGMV